MILITIIVVIVVAIVAIVVIRRRHQHQHPVPLPVPVDSVESVYEDIDFNLDDPHNVHNEGLQQQLPILMNSLRDSLEKYGECHIPQPQLFDCTSTESELYKLVWERINCPINQDVKTTMIEKYLEAAHSCKDFEDCTDGRIMRMIECLVYLDTESICHLVPSWYFDEEISTTISNWKSKKFDTETLIRELEEKFHKDYIESGLMTQSYLTKLTSEYYKYLRNPEK